jgi:hypothetical protein
MHYIRLMRPPSLDEQRKLRLVISITTDLGDSFLCPDAPLPISVFLTGVPSGSSDDEQTQTCCLTSRKAGKSEFYWKQGMRILKLDLPVPEKVFKSLEEEEEPPRAKPAPTIRIVASRNLESPPKAADLPFDVEGRVLAVESELPWPPGGERAFESVRRLALADGDFLQVDERIGESIDRHVWDAGVVTAGVLVNMCQRGVSEHTWHSTPLLKELLCSVAPEQPLNVIELGCGVGILGLGLAAALYRRVSSSRDPENSTQPPNRILLTDLTDAKEVALANIASEKKARQAVSMKGKARVDTDFECLDWDEGRAGVFGPKAQASGWDLIIVSDCTYNVDMLVALVKTISGLHELSMYKDGKSPKVMLATKPRHSSEEALFDLMDEDGWKILESASQPLHVLGLEDQTVDIYLFGKDAEQPPAGDAASSTPSAPKRRKLR